MGQSKPYTLTLENFEHEYEDLLKLAIGYGKILIKEDNYFKEAYDYAQDVLLKIYLKLVAGDKLSKTQIESKEAFIYIMIRNAFLNDLKEVRKRDSLEFVGKNKPSVADNDNEEQDNGESTAASEEGKHPFFSEKEQGYETGKFEIKAEYSIHDLFDQNNPVGKSFLSFLQNSRQFEVLKYEFLGEKSKYRNIGEAVLHEPQLSGLTRDNYDQLKLRGLLKLKIFLFTVRPHMLGGLSRIKKILLDVKENKTDNRLTQAEKSEIESFETMLTDNKEQVDMSSLLQRLKSGENVNDEMRNSFRELAVHISDTHQFSKEGKSAFMRFAQQLDNKLLPEDVDLFYSVVVDQNQVPRGKKEKFTYLCEKLINYFSVLDFG